VLAPTPARTNGPIRPAGLPRRRSSCMDRSRPRLLVPGSWRTETVGLRTSGSLPAGALPPRFSRDADLSAVATRSVGANGVGAFTKVNAHGLSAQTQTVRNRPPAEEPRPRCAKARIVVQSSGFARGSAPGQWRASEARTHVVLASSQCLFCGLPARNSLRRFVTPSLRRYSCYAAR
jgi:hypothetical protein